MDQAPWFRTTHRLVESVLTLVILTVICYVWFFCAVHAGHHWYIQDRDEPLKGWTYIALSSILLFSLLSIYSYLIGGQHTHRVPNFTTPNELALLEPYITSSPHGRLAHCKQDSCNGRWKPPRTHHCSACGVCRMEFDHHCPWLANCVTLARFKLFLLFLLLIPTTFLILAYPLRNIFATHICSAYQASKQDPYWKAHWWGWYGSWIFLGGRYFWGTVLGFGVLSSRQTEGLRGKAILIEEPQLKIAILVVSTGVMSAFTLILFFTSLITVLRGQTSYERIRPARNVTARATRLNKRPPTSRILFICVPYLASLQGKRASSSHEAGHDHQSHNIVRLSPNERPYDLGWKMNWKEFWDRPLFPVEAPGRVERDWKEFRWPKIDPSISARQLKDKTA